jgi:hypothetical protein
MAQAQGTKTISGGPQETQFFAFHEPIGGRVLWATLSFLKAPESGVLH